MAPPLKIVVEKHSDGCVAYPLGLARGAVVGQGDTYEAALSDVRSATAFHFETFGAAALASAEVLTLFGLPADGTAPNPTTFDELVQWADAIVKGDADAVAAGYPAMANPGAGEVAAVLATARLQAADVPTADRAYVEAQQAIADIMADCAPACESTTKPPSAASCAPTAPPSSPSPANPPTPKPPSPPHHPTLPAGANPNNPHFPLMLLGYLAIGVAKQSSAMLRTL